MDSPPSSPRSKKLKYTKVVHDILEVTEDEASVGVFIIHGGGDNDNLVEATKMTYGKNWEHEVKDTLTEEELDPTTSADPDVNGISSTSLEDSEHGSDTSDDVADESTYYDSDGIFYEEEFSSYDDTLSLQAQFDAADLPPGVEASVPWLEEHPISKTKSSATCSYSICQANEGEEEHVLKKYLLFKKFDTVEDFSDHHYCNKQGSESVQVSQEWTKTIQREWKILEKDLPDTIFVRVYEERMDLLRAVIIGAAGTPYHDGLFFFDLRFPSGYPKVPPLVYYHSGGLRLNPNLYNCGKVCLSLLNTWPGKDAQEQWTPGTSTVLQVLLSIQALVLNEKPFFNEPGFAEMVGREDGEMQAVDYNEDTFVLSCKTMLYSLRNPPKHFEDLVWGHFRERAQAILEACKAYIKGVQVGLPIGSEVEPVVEKKIKKRSYRWGSRGEKQDFKTSLRTVIASLLPALIKNGAKDCEKFIPLGDVNRTAPLTL